MLYNFVYAVYQCTVYGMYVNSVPVWLEDTNLKTDRLKKNGVKVRGYGLPYVD